MIDEACALADAGFHIFELAPGKKTPLRKDWQKQAGRHAEFRWTVSPDANIGIYTGAFGDGEALLVVDVDVKHGHRGDETLLQLELEGFEFPVTREQRTPTGGRHLIYRVKQAVKQGANVLGPGLDIRSRGGYIVGAGSTIDGKPYTMNDAPIVDAPAWLVERCGTRAPAERASTEPLPGVDLVEAERRAAEWLKTAEPAVQGAGGDHHTYAVAARVKDFGVTQDMALGLMLEHWNERCAPPWSVEDLTTKVRNAYAYGTAPVGAKAASAEFGAVELPAAATSDHPILCLNADNAYVLAGGGDHILHETTDEHGHHKLLHLKVDTFHRLHAARRITIGKRTLPLTQAWMEDAGRRTYRGIVFMPQGGAPADFYNLWRGFAVEPLERGVVPEPRWQAALDAWREHALKNVCQGDEKLCRWLIGWFAHAVQRPGEKPLAALVFRGGKGVGKNALVGRVAALLGGHAITAASKRYLIGQFNGHLEACLMMTLDEAFWSGDKATDGVLKDLITGDTHMIEHKGKDVYTVRNLTRVIIIGNEEWLVPASHDERRFAVFDVGAGRRLDADFFEEMRLGMEAGGYRLLLRWLLDYPLDGLDFRAAPSTPGLLAQKTQSLPPMQAWWHDALNAGYFEDMPGSQDWPAAPVSAVAARAAFSSWCRRKGVGLRWQATDTDLARQFTRISEVRGKPTYLEGRTVHAYTLPPLAEARARWERFIGHAEQWLMPASKPA